jgi:hypothetical protein
MTGGSEIKRDGKKIFAEATRAQSKPGMADRDGLPDFNPYRGMIAAFFPAPHMFIYSCRS